LTTLNGTFADYTTAYIEMKMHFNQITWYPNILVYRIVWKMSYT